MARRSSIRASDEDRERVAERLRQAATEGRILAHELEERLATALRAKTYGELDAVVYDLPRAGAPARRGSTTLRVARSHPVLAVAALVAVTLVFFMIAAVVLAGLFAFSGVWMLLALIIFARRGRWYGPGFQNRYRYRHGAGGPYPGGRGGGRHPRWVP